MIYTPFGYASVDLFRLLPNHRLALAGGGLARHARVAAIVALLAAAVAEVALPLCLLARVEVETHGERRELTVEVACRHGFRPRAGRLVSRHGRGHHEVTDGLAGIEQPVVECSHGDFPQLGQVLTPPVAIVANAGQKPQTLIHGAKQRPHPGHRHPSITSPPPSPPTR